MNKTYAEENAIERQRLFMLTDKLTEANGWSVTSKLAHLACVWPPTNN
jgi:hypothetical protein